MVETESDASISECDHDHVLMILGAWMPHRAAGGNSLRIRRSRIKPTKRNNISTVAADENYCHQMDRWSWLKNGNSH